MKETEQSSKRQPGTPFEREPNLATRLFVVDASKSAEQLRARFPDRKHYLIVRAMVRAHLETIWDPVKASNVPREWLGFVAEILPGEIHVPLPMASALPRLGPELITSPRFTVTLCYGRHLEPWISAIKLQPARE